MSQGRRGSPDNDLRAKLARAGRELSPAFHSTWPYTLIGQVIGFILLVASERIPGSFHLLAVILEHLGVGFFVSSVAVFFYEWGAHSKKALDLAEKLEGLVHASADDALDRSLRELLPASPPADDPGYPTCLPEVTEEIKGLVAATARLARNGIWSKAEQMACVREHLETLRRNVLTLSSLTGDSLHHFKVPSLGAEVIDGLLAAQMRAAREGDRYDVITTYRAWSRDRLEELQREVRAAILERNIPVRRIFNLVYQAARLEDLGAEEREELHDILLGHCRDLRELGPGYEVRVFRKEHLTPALRDRVGSAHFGLFTTQDGKRLHVRSESPDISDVLLATNASDYERDVVFFERAWKVADPLTEKLVEELLG